MKILKLLLAFVLLTLFYACNEDSVKPQNEEPEELPDALTADEAAMVDNLPTAQGFELDDVVLPNGINLIEFMNEVDPDFLLEWGRTHESMEDLGPQDARNALIGKLTVAAHNLADISRHSTRTGQPNGIGYVYGGKDHTIKSAATAGVCEDEAYGLDCSGFIHQIFKAAGVNLTTGSADNQRKPNTLSQAIKAAYPGLDKAKVEDLGELETSKIETGDIIYWMKDNKAFHIGIVLKDESGNKAVYQSNGVPGKSDDDCDDNMGAGRGVRKISLNSTYWFGTDKKYGVVRINVEISGSYKLFLRCQGSFTDALALDLDFPTDAGNTFTATGGGIDYDGLPLTCEATLTYDNTTNELSGYTYLTKVDQPAFYRYDHFTAKLNRDNTDYFTMTLGDNNDAGCPVEGRLLNQD